MKGASVRYYGIDEVSVRRHGKDGVSVAGLAVHARRPAHWSGERSPWSGPSFTDAVASVRVQRLSGKGGC